MAIKVEHCKKALEFFVRMNNSRAVLQYRVLPNHVLDFHHTEVPPEQQGKGVAKQLVVVSPKERKEKGGQQEGFRYALDNHFKVLPSCSYVAKFVREQATPEQKNIVVPLSSL